MRILVLGAGATGGYFGGWLARTGADVTFLVRPKRAESLARTGLVIRTPEGTEQFPVRTVTADAIDAPYDVVLLSCKAYDLDSAIASVAPAVGAGTTVVPLLNGLAHYPVLDRAFGADRVLGGLCHIFGSVGPEGEIIRNSPLHRFTIGERAGGMSPRVEALAAICAKAPFDTVASTNLMQAAWEKFSFLAALAASTCLMRASIGAIMATEGGETFLRGLYAETRSVAQAAGHDPSEATRAEALGLLTAAGSAATASMLRDIE
ncbi:MAG TPA: ketopantoate reductase family protein, partial [Magnetospirillum sp.]|nr:ketopantoate reductase family protein [Magnetospirillum sp.]